MVVLGKEALRQGNTWNRDHKQIDEVEFKGKLAHKLNYVFTELISFLSHMLRTFGVKKIN